MRLGASVAAALLLGSCTAGGSAAPSKSTAVVPPSAGLASPGSSLALTTPTPAPATTPDPSYVAGLHEKAQDELARWAVAVKEAGDGALVLIGPLTDQVGQPEEAVAGDFKDALMCGLVEPAVTLPATTPAAGTVRWPDGTSQQARLISARQAVADIRGAIQPLGCDRQPLRLTDARFGTANVMTSRGPALAPAWVFGVRGTAAKVTRIAVADRVRLEPLDPHGGQALLSATASRGGREVTVTFAGAPGTGDKLCGEDYTAEAVESDLAVVVIVISHHHPPSPAPPSGPYACTLIGADRTASVTLASPLGRRTVLETAQGMPVPVLDLP